MADTHFTPFTPEQVARFWAKVGPPDANGCRLWLASQRNGYGQFGVQIMPGRWVPTGAHRLAWMLTFGPAPAGAVFRHSCDRPLCCEPTHITPGTQAENIADAVARGRIATGERSGPLVHPEVHRGERHGMAKLTQAKVLAIRKALANGMTQRQAAVEFGLCPQHVHRIASGKSWGWLKEHETEESPAPSETTQGRGHSGGSHPEHG